jgi:transposase
MRTLTRKLAGIEPNMLLAGVDLAADKNVVVVINQQAKRLGRMQFGHHRDGYTSFRERLGQLCQQHQADGVLVGMEPTGHYWKLVAAELAAHQIPYRLVNAYTVKKHREGDQLDRAKDDNRDGFVIADLLRTGKFTDSQRLTGVYAELRQYSAGYERLKQEAVRQKNLLHQAVGQTFPEWGQVFKSLKGQTVRAMLCHHAAAQAIAGVTEEAFLQGVKADYPGKRVGRRQLEQAYQLAQTSVGLVETEALQLTIQGYLKLLALLEQQLAEVEDRLVSTFLTLPPAPYLLSLGLGQVTTARILAEIGDPADFSNGRQWVKLAGIQPTPNRSGRQTNSPTPMSGKGRGQLRTVLYFGCLGLIQRDATFANYYHALQQRPHNPLKPMQAIGVLMHKALHILWALNRDQVFYDPHTWHPRPGS